MKFNKLTNKIKLSGTLMATAIVASGAILSVPLFLSTNHTNNLDYKNIVDQNNNQITNISDFSSQPAEIQDFFSVYDKKKIYANNASDSLFAVVTRDDGFDTLYAWGQNNLGQLGLGDIMLSYYPARVEITGLTNYNITHIVSSPKSTTIVVNGNQIWFTGSNTFKEFGVSSLKNTYTFIKNTEWGGSIIESLYAGSNYRIAITKDRVWAWGHNFNGQLGNGTKEDLPTPSDITTEIATAIPNWKSGKFYVSDATTAMLVNGELYMWGANGEKQLGKVDAVDDVPTPPTTPVTLPSKILKYSMGGKHSLALLENGELYSWGYNKYGQLGINSEVNNAPTKVTLNGLLASDITDMFISKNTSFIQIGNAIYSCGDNGHGILAQGNSVVDNKIFSPIILEPGAEILEVLHPLGTLMVNLKSGLYVAGSNQYGQFANGKNTLDVHSTLAQVAPFGTPTKLITKTDNQSYTADEVVSDLSDKATTADIKTALAKYVDGVDSIPSESVLKYKVLPVANADKTKVSMTLTTNTPYNEDGVKTGTEFDIFLEIINFKAESLNLGLIIGLSAGGVALIVIISFIIWKIRARKSQY